MYHYSWIPIVVLTAACSGSPSAPTPPPPVPQTFTIAGTLTSTNGGSPLTASMDFGVATTTAQNGSFSVSVPVSAPTLNLTISGTGLVTRRAYVAPGARTVNLDAISESGFDLAFYRRLVRNGNEGGNEPLRRWTSNPNLYIQTADQDAATLGLIEATARAAVQEWSNGALAIGVVERGTSTREGQSGWITIRWVADSAGPCGTALVAVSGGWVQFNATAACRCNGFGVAAGTVRHEFGHALGFFHTDSPTDLMWGGTWSGCDRQPSARERYHAAIAYKRPVGNMDPDQDPSGAVNLAPMQVR